MAVGIWGLQVDTALESLALSLKAKLIATKVQLLIASNTPIMTEKLDDEGNVVKNKVTGEAEKVPLKDDNGDTVYCMSKEDADAAIEAMDKSTETIINANKAEGKLLASKLNQLQQATTGMIGRIASSAVALIGTCPTGPTFSPQLLMPLLQTITGEAQNLSSIYDEVEDRLKKVQLDKESIQNARFDEIELDESQIPPEAQAALAEIKPLIDTVNTMAGEKLPTAIKVITTPINTLLTTVETVCSACGAACGSKEADMEIPEVDSPVDPKEAKDCESYTGEYQDPSQAHNRTPDNCTKFQGVMDGVEKTCDNCKYYRS